MGSMGSADPPPSKGIGAPHQCSRVNEVVGGGVVTSLAMFRSRMTPEVVCSHPPITLAYAKETRKKKKKKKKKKQVGDHSRQHS